MSKANENQQSQPRRRSYWLIHWDLAEVLKWKKNQEHTHTRTSICTSIECDEICHLCRFGRRPLFVPSIVLVTPSHAKVNQNSRLESQVAWRLPSTVCLGFDGWWMVKDGRDDCKTAGIKISWVKWHVEDVMVIFRPGSKRDICKTTGWILKWMVAQYKPVELCSHHETLENDTYQVCWLIKYFCKWKGMNSVI